MRHLIGVFLCLLASFEMFAMDTAKVESVEKNGAIVCDLLERMQLKETARHDEIGIWLQIEEKNLVIIDHGNIQNIDLDELAARSDNEDIPFSARPSHIVYASSESNSDTTTRAAKKYARIHRYDAFFLKFEPETTVNEIVSAIIEALKLENKILDPRKMATGDKLALRRYYQTWHQRENMREIVSKDFLTIVDDNLPDCQISNCIRAAHQCHFDNIGQIFDYGRFSDARHPPVHVATIMNKNNFDFPFADVDTFQPQDMPIAFPTHNKNDYQYRLPLDYKNLEEFVVKVASTWHSLEPDFHRYYAYLSISHGDIPPWQNQRRPNIHSDGFQGARVEPKELNEYTFVVANAMPTVFYSESFDTSTLDPNVDNFFSAYSKSSTRKPSSRAKKYQIIMMDAYCLHAATTNYSCTPVKRTFARIIYSTRKYDRKGNAHNPAFDYQWEMVRREALEELKL